MKLRVGVNVFILFNILRVLVIFCLFWLLNKIENSFLENKKELFRDICIFGKVIRINIFLFREE